MDDAGTPPPPPPPPAPSFWRGQWSVVAVVALGGGLGTAARYGAGLLWPTQGAGFPWTTLLVNVVGCGSIGVLTVLVTEVWATPAHRLVRPFLGTGVLGGFTTFSTYSQDIERHLTEGRALTAVSYLLLTLVGALAAVLGTTAATRRLGRRA